MQPFQFQYVSMYEHFKRFERPGQVLRRIVQDPQLDAPEIQPHCCCRQDSRLGEESFCTSSSSSSSAEIVIGTNTGTRKLLQVLGK